MDRFSWVTVSLQFRGYDTLNNGHTPKSDIPPNVAQKNVTPDNYLQICDSSATMIGQLAIVTIFGAILGGIPLSGAYPYTIQHPGDGFIER